MKSYDWQNVRLRLSEALRFVPQFARHPVRGMRALPDWDWPTILILQAALAATTGSLSSLIARNWTLMVTSLVVAPVTYVVVNAAVAGVFYGLSKVMFKRDVPFRQIYLSSVLASAPGHLILVLSALFPPLMLVGAVAWAILIYQAFTVKFHLPRAGVRNLLALFLVIYAGLTVRQFLNTKSHRVYLKERASPESLDILEHEINPPERKTN